MPYDTTAISGDVKNLLPLRAKLIEAQHPSWNLFKCLLSPYRCLGFKGTVGENMKYLIFDNNKRLLACLLFGSAAWSCAARNDFIRWDRDTRINHLRLITNNTLIDTTLV
ncbi:MAG: DUF4338 domain-containing protein [Syntrophomonadaceae bacterium]|nr:DUF4338 domain-containing protein [Syntrophomonadaceae bacterium]